MTQRTKKILEAFATSGFVALMAFAIGGLVSVNKASADALDGKSDVMTRLEASVASNHTIEFNLSSTGGGIAAGQTITVTFPAGFDTSTIVFGDVDLADDGVDIDLAGTCATTTWGAAMASDVLTLTSCTGTIAADSTVTIEIGTNAAHGVAGTHQITNDVAGVATIVIGGDNGDSGNIKVELVADDTVHVTAAVDESINFEISDVTIGFGDLNTSAARWATGTSGSDTDSAAAHTLTVGTNATNGYSVTYNGATLTSGTDTITVAAITDDEDGDEGSAEEFGMGFSVTGVANASVATGYDHNATPANRDWTFVAGTTPIEIVSDGGPSADETISAFYLANISSLTESGSYETDITYIATATF